MADNDISAELAVMREQLQQLERQRADPVPTAPAAPATATATEPLQATISQAEDVAVERSWLAELEELEAEDILDRLRSGAVEWLQDLDNDLKDVKPSTLLMVFGAGVLVGKLTN